MKERRQVSALDDLRSQIKFRGLKESGLNDPVTEFTGNFDGFDIVEAMFNNQPTGRNNVVLKFSGLEPTETVSSEPYPYPNKEISIGFSDRRGSRWGIFAESGLKFLKDSEEFGDLIGKRMSLKQVVHKLFQGKERGQQDTPCWEIVGVEGASTSSTNGKESASALTADKQLLMILNGRTEQQFNMEALRLPAVKSDSALTTRILNRTWFAEVISKGLVTKDDAGAYALTEAGVASLQG